MRWPSFFSIFFLLFLACLFAEQFTTKDGKIFEGTVLDQDEQNIYLDTSSGVVNLSKMDLVTYAGDRVTREPGIRLDAPKDKYFITENEVENPVAYIGRGALSQSMYDEFLEAAAKEKGKTRETLTLEEKKAALDKAIEEEIHAHFEKYPERFRKPIKLLPLFQYINYPLGKITKEEAKATAKALKENPEPTNQWSAFQDQFNPTATAWIT